MSSRSFTISFTDLTVSRLTGADTRGQNSARYARSGGGGKGVCPVGLADDWLAFWGKMQTSCCSGTF